ncbi:hypothetical protein [Arthrobacter sp. 35W]|uniref:hypothetical protein n=1 Tax=Arthrobacter sp. 35W TaxID=1132441 RepID=UPI0003FE08D6|nr:hypothetical protein [Arthrobacter sp. 35W]
MSMRITRRAWRPASGDLWPALEPEETVALVNANGWRLSGRVEAVTPDHSCLWIQLDGGMGRQLIHHQDGFALESRAKHNA